MTMKVNLGVIEMDLEKIAKLVREMLSINVDGNTKNDIKELIEEVSKAYDELVDCYVDFKPLRKNDDVFENSFSQLYGKFEKAYLKSPEDKIASCGKIHSALNKISKSHWYLNNLPKLNKKIEEFNLSSDAWCLDDTVMVETFKEFNRRIYEDLKAIEESYGNESVASSREKLNMFVSKWDKEFLDLRTKLGKFKSISDSIK